MEQRHYEAVFILTPVLSEQQMKETVVKFKDYLKEKGADVYHEENWGLRKLAYPIEKKSTGFYCLFEFKATPELIQTFEIELSRDEKIMRYLTVKLDKYGVEYNEKRRKELKNKKEVKKQEA